MSKTPVWSVCESLRLLKLVAGSVRVVALRRQTSPIQLTPMSLEDVLDPRSIPAGEAMQHSEFSQAVQLEHGSPGLQIRLPKWCRTGYFHSAALVGVHRIRHMFQAGAACAEVGRSTVCSVPGIKWLSPFTRSSHFSLIVHDPAHTMKALNQTPLNIASHRNISRQVKHCPL